VLGAERDKGVYVRQGRGRRADKPDVCCVARVLRSVIIPMT
jgi:hypothetical protein